MVKNSIKFEEMHFPISIKQGSRVFHLLAQQIYVDARIQRYKIWPEKDPDKYVILENNKPLIRDKKKLKNRKIDWRVIEHTGPKISKSTTEQYVHAIIMHYIPPEPTKKVEPITPPRTRKESINSPTTTLGERARKNKSS
jgi:hypothetical protein